MNLVNHLDNNLNPLLLRELRQLVRNRYIIVLINLFVAVLVMVCIFMVLLTDGPLDRATGGGLFAALTGIMGFACFLAVVVYTAIGTATERINGDLMFATALKPSQIVLGKFFSGAILTFLLMSVTFPFVTLAYLLRGLDFQMMLISFGTTFLSIQVMNSLAIFVFSNVKTYVQMFFGIVVAGFLCLWGFGTGTMLLFLFASGRAGHHSYFGTGTDWTWQISMTLSQLGIICFFLAAAVATIAPPTANRMLPLRIVVTTAFLLSLAYCGFVFSGSPDVFRGWVVSWLCALIPLLLLAVCERETWTYRVKKTIPGNFVLRMLVFPFYTGSPCGLVWIALLLGVIALIASGGLLSLSLSHDFWKLPLALLFAFNYCVTALLIRSLIAPKIPTDKIWAVALALLLLFTFGSMLTYYLMKGDIDYFDNRYSDHPLSALNPFLLADNFEQTYRMFAAMIWAVLLAFPFLFWFALRIREFTPSPPSDMMTLEDAVAAVKYADENPMVKGRRENES